VNRAVRYLVLGAVALVVLVGGGTYLYIHVIEGSPPAPLSITSGNTNAPNASNASNAANAATEGTTTGVSGTWEPTSESTVGYRVKENLFGQNATAVGRTDAVTGTLVIDNTTVKQASFTVDLTKVSSDRSQRDAQFQGRIMDTADFPTATFRLTTPIELGDAVPAEGKVVSYKATGALTLHGQTRTVTFTLKAKRSGDTLLANGSIPVTFADYGIPNPTFGPVSTENHGQLEFLLVFAQS
jgi:polyisoprenoid-binding protein YceI